MQFAARLRALPCLTGLVALSISLCLALDHFAIEHDQSFIRSITSKSHGKNKSPLETLLETPNLTIIYYDVAGLSQEDLRRSLDANGPIDQFGKRRDAYTGWHIKWHWNRSEDGEYEFKSTTSTYSIKVQLPNWVDRSSTSPKIQELWDRNMQAILEHELGHVRIVLENYLEVGKAIQSAAISSLVTDPEEMNRIALLKIEEIRTLDQSYDEETQSGKQQGVGKGLWY